MKKNNKKIWISVVVIILIVLAYLVGQGSSEQTDNSSNKLISDSTNKSKSVPEMSPSEIFANKTKCEGYLDKLQQNVVASALEIDVIYKVFYSQSLNTCLVEQYNLYPAHDKIVEGEVLLINDVLTGGNIWTSQTYSPELKYWDAEPILDQEAQQYQ